MVMCCMSVDIIHNWVKCVNEYTVACIMLLIEEEKGKYLSFWFVSNS